jgi:uncharacterized protein YecA (UPF0149 family)
MDRSQLKDIIAPLLRQNGISMEQIGNDKIEKLLALTDTIDPGNIPPTLTQDVVSILKEKGGGEPRRNIEPKQKRNDPCPCGSGKKYKKCCI